MKTLLEVLNLSTDFLAKEGIESPRREAENLICDALQIKKMQLYLEFDRPVEEKELALLRNYLKRRSKGEPAAYIHGKVEFYGCTLEVNPHVLIPRQETEILVDMIAKELEGQDLQGKKLLDLCSGSGCIGLSLKKKLPELEVVLSDFSSKALETAKKNGSLNQVQVSYIQGDLLAPFKNEKFNYIVCNPPYISQKDYESLSKEVLHFEPKEALLAGSTGLEYYERLNRDLPSHLTPSGRVWLEIGEKQGSSILNLFNQPHWKQKQVIKDWAGKDRFISLEIE